MHNKRYVRFASISGIEVADLPIAAEIWLQDISTSPWATREIIKLANLFLRYMQDPNPDKLRLDQIDYSLGLDKSQVLDILRLMVIYGATESYQTDNGVVRAALKLSYLQRLRVLDVRDRFSALHDAKVNGPLPWHKREEKWMLKNALEAVDETQPDSLKPPQVSASSA